MHPLLQHTLLWGPHHSAHSQRALSFVTFHFALLLLHYHQVVLHFLHALLHYCHVLCHDSHQSYISHCNTPNFN
ncbi:hypothetical protein LguiA_011252 [Lonicera macranthoides]